MKLHLPMVTVCAADCVNHELAARALVLSMRDCVFGDAVLFSDRLNEGPFRSEVIAPLRSRADYSGFVLRDLHRRVRTPFVLIVQWDGFVLDAGAWTDRFLDYDYVGAVWPWFTDRRVGNGGFSLRSSRLLQATAALPSGSMDDHEDIAICRYWADVLESNHGVCFAPEAVAKQFSYERALPEGSTFGFHGLFNMWRHLNDDELVRIASMVDVINVGQREFVECMLHCGLHGRLQPLNGFYGRLRAQQSPDEILHHVDLLRLDRAAAATVLAVAEKGLFIRANDASVGRPTDFAV